MANEQPLKISIVIPSYNQGHFIGQTIESILTQDYPNVEIVVQDGGSTDSTKEVLKSFGQQLRWESKPDKGQTDAINKGLKQVSGEIVMYLNSDDILLPGSLTLIATAFQHHPQARWLTGNYQIIDAHGTPRESVIVWYKYFWRLLFRVFPGLWPVVLGVLNPIAQPATCWRREVHQQIGYLDESWHYTMDYEWWWRLWRQYGPPLQVNPALAAFRIHGASKTGANDQRQVTEQLEIAQHYKTPRFLLFVQRIHSWIYQRIYDLRK